MAQFVADLAERIAQLEKIVANPSLKEFWVGGFASPSAFFTAVRCLRLCSSCRLY
jgi:hypothetical protein